METPGGGEGARFFPVGMGRTVYQALRGSACGRDRSAVAMTDGRIRDELRAPVAAPGP